jgi:hypothetical protein
MVLESFSQRIFRTSAVYPWTPFAEADPAVEAQTEVQAQPKAAGAVNDTTVAIRTVALHPYCLVDALKERINLLLVDECSVLTLKSADLFDLDGDAILLAA